MAENPATWTPATRVIAEAIKEHERLVADGFLTLTLPAFIHGRMVRAGLLSEGT